MQRVVLTLIRAYFAVAGRIAPRLAGRTAFNLFCTPRVRKPPPRRMEQVMKRAELRHLEHGCEKIAFYRWRPGAATDPPNPSDSTTPPTTTPPTTAPPRRALLVHGWESRAARLAQWVEPLIEQGFEVVAFDGPAHGESTGKRTTMPAFIAAMRAVVDQTGPVDAVVGHSFGAAAAVLASSPVVREIGLEPLQPQRVVLLAGPDRVDDVIDRFGAFLALPGRSVVNVKARVTTVGGLPIEVYSVSRLLDETGLPALVAHDRQDEEIPWSDADRIATAPGVELLATEGLGHHRIARDAAVIARGVAFLDEVRSR